MSGPPRAEDPLRRAALLATAVAVPVVAVLIALVNVIGGTKAGDGAPAAVEGSTPSGRGDLPVLDVPTPAVDAATDPAGAADCEPLVEAVPFELTGKPARRVRSESPYVRAWGDPPVVLVCGGERPAGFTAGAGLIQINGVQWYVDTTDPATTIWTAVDRPVYVEVRVPAESDSSAVTQLTGPISTTLDRTELDPAG